MMKPLPSIIALLLLLTLIASAKAQNVNIPDANFKAYLVGNAAINTNGDTEIQVEEAEAFTGLINCLSKNIANLTGVEAFVNITKLYCGNNQLTALDVSKNTALKELGCYNNQLTALDVSKNTALIYLSCYGNQLTSLDVSKNTVLTALDCYGNQLTNLDVSKNTALIYLYCESNQLTALDVTKNTALTNLICYSNQLTSLNIKSGNNTALTYMYAVSNPSLTCIQVDNVANANAKPNWSKDATASYNTDCRPIVNIPDANFKAYLVGNAAINTDGDTEIQVEEAEAFTGTIAVTSKNISNLTGIAAFVNIINLYCDDNQLTSLDLTKNTLLKDLRCQNNQLTSLNISKSTVLTTLICQANQLTSLDVSKNTALQQLWCGENQLINLDVTQNTDLVYLICNNNQLTNLDVSKNTSLLFFDCRNNQLTNLNVKSGQNSIIIVFYSTNNPNLTCIHVDNVANSNSYTNWYKPATASYSEDCYAVLPLTLISFTAKADGNHAKLQWQTANEVNHKGFEIWRKSENGNAEGLAFVKIGEIKTKPYTFTDKTPANKTNYYKLVQIDNDGTATDLGVKLVNFDFSAAAVHIFPNPTKDRINISLDGLMYTSLLLSDVSGRVLESIQLQPKQKNINLDLSKYQKGPYFIKLLGTVNKTFKVIKH